MQILIIFLFLAIDDLGLTSKVDCLVVMDMVVAQGRRMLLLFNYTHLLLNLDGVLFDLFKIRSDLIVVVVLMNNSLIVR